MISFNIIFIGGIHGVGKGVICKEICASGEIEYLSASKLIKWEEVSPDIKNKKVKDIPNTQDRLIQALSKKCKKDQTYLLDGHFCLLDSESKINRIPTEVFKSISPRIIILVSEEPKIVVSRLKKRDRKNYSVQLISEMLNQENKYSIQLANSLNIGHYHIHPLNKNEMIEKLKNKL